MVLYSPILNWRGIGMVMQRCRIGLVAILLAGLVLIAACGGFGVPDGVIEGQLQGPNEAMADAEVSLMFRIPDCEGEDCIKTYATTTSDQGGKYRFDDVEAGVYRITFMWELGRQEFSELPDKERGGFTVFVASSREDPELKYLLGMSQDINFSGEGMEVGFDYNDVPEPTPSE